MIFRRALQRELASVAGATFTVLFSILVTWTLITILGRAAGGKVASGDVLALIAFAVLNYLPTILILTSFISVLVVITRSYRDSEMVVWFASGQSLTRWIAPVLVFGLPIVILVAVISLVAMPWAQLKSNEFTERFEKREDLQRVAPGQFRESAAADRVFFVESSAARSSTVVQNVFVNTIDQGVNTTVVAKEGQIEPDGKGGQYLVLKNGRRYQGTPGKPDFQSMEFERYRMRVATQAPVLGDLKVEGMSTPALPSTKNTRLADVDSLNWPGATRFKSSRFSKRSVNSVFLRLAHGVATSDSTATSTTSGSPNVITGRIQRTSDWPEANQTTISESR